MLIDTHCHLHDLEFFTLDQQTEFLQNAHENSVKKIICIGTSHEDSLNAHDFASKHEDVYWTYGIHPEFASTAQLPDDIFPQDKPVAIGEIGLDYHYDGYDRDAQIKLFEQMLQLAQDHDLPVSLHIREAFVDAFAVLDNFPQVTGVVHSFTGSKRDLKKSLERGFYVGVNGLATYTTTPLPPLERMLLETDAPFLAPVPLRGVINQPAYVYQIATYLATKLSIPEAEIAMRTTANAKLIFRI